MSKIVELNDAFRKSFTGGRVVVTAGVGGLAPEVRSAVIQKVRTFDSFTYDNDPFGEHDFGNFEYAGEKFFWKIDHYNSVMTGGSEDPADPSKTTRVLTIMLACEY
jgi:Protein of unknown function (DUF3768)